ncbi:MAG: tyrosine-type recombinase/integrase, partial [Alicyclobacillaceae bacterium]|nr:tyrosine-type recombinase/integrase [Alicyclobacillaceae bacterium]
SFLAQLPLSASRIPSEAQVSHAVQRSFFTGLLKPYHLRELYGRLQREKGLSARYVSQIHTLLHDALDTALKWELVTRNVADNVEAPKPARTRFTVWSLDEVRRFLSAPEVKSHRFYLAFLLALTTGMRIGEILALQWQDVDLDSATLQVRRTITMRGATAEFGPPKSESGERIITLPREVVDALRQHRARQAQEKLLMGPAYHDMDLVIARSTGNVVTPQFLRAKFVRLIEQLGLPRIRFHDLRHTHSSILLELGENLKTLQERLGHASYQITADTYTHVSRTLRIRPAQLLSEALFRSNK